MHTPDHVNAFLEEQRAQDEFARHMERMSRPAPRRIALPSGWLIALLVFVLLVLTHAFAFLAGRAAELQHRSTAGALSEDYL